MASESEKKDAQDTELDELLDSALDDFEKTNVPRVSSNVQPSAEAKGGQKSSLMEDNQFFESLFEGEMANQAREEWEKAMAELAQEEPELLQQFQKLSEAAGKVGTDAASQQEFASCLKETLSGLAKNTDNLQAAGLAGEDLAKTLEGLGLDESSEGGGDDGNILPIMQSIMQNLLSKDVLYPSLKEITEKYPDWLKNNRHSLPPVDIHRYEQQHRIMGEICSQFERDGDGQSNFESILELMQKLQDLGQPPKELAGEAPPGLNFDLESLHLPGTQGAVGAEQCIVM
ncbi:peroxisomal biogenesis factor 19 isoform X1 [Electrophorus electricus]|uniref:Peroxisomal biogenesis factor 19 n=1 Tax=Electrophorus electricus TaxID=8005 RepID=A0A4W4EM41_ELEEL|nr:peroxisomal biogenesis factor 19 isoform X1 [Electrophorus electricus]